MQPPLNLACIDPNPDKIVLFFFVRVLPVVVVARTLPVNTATAAAIAVATAGFVTVVVGWILVDQGLRFPGAQYAAISQSVGAHDPMVASGNMTIMLLGAFFLEMVGGAAIFGAASGSGRAPGKPTFSAAWYAYVILLILI